MLKDFTLLVPVRDRHHNLKNVSTYYSDLDSKKLIVDSSTTPYDDIKTRSDDIKTIPDDIKTISLSKDKLS